MSKTPNSSHPPSSIFTALKSYAPSFLGLVAFSGMYTALVFTNSASLNLTALNQIQVQSQNFNVAKKLNAEKLSTDKVGPLRAVASPFETE